jgi:hypothetical protein
MKIELTLERLEEIALCIVHNELNEDDACEYIKAVAFECHEETVKQSNETLEWIL